DDEAEQRDHQVEGASWTETVDAIAGADDDDGRQDKPSERDCRIDGPCEAQPAPAEDDNDPRGQVEQGTPAPQTDAIGADREDHQGRKDLTRNATIAVRGVG